MTPGRCPAPDRRAVTAPAGPAPAGRAGGGSTGPLTSGGNQMTVRLAARSGQPDSAVDDGLVDRIRASLRGGSPLPAPVRAEAEAGLGRPLGDVRIHTDGTAAALATDLDAHAFTAGTDVFFNTGVYDPTSAGGFNVLMHELAHTLQPSGGGDGPLTVSHVDDPDERQAQAVADRVSAARAAGAAPADGPLPTGGTGSASVRRLGAGGLEVRRLGSTLDRPVGGHDPQPLAELPHAKRAYSVEQYEQMWEREQGRKLTEPEKQTIRRGCIGLTVANLDGSGNPPLDEVYSSFTEARQVMLSRNGQMDFIEDIPLFGRLVEGARWMVFAQLFWSNQNKDPDRRRTIDPKAFRPDEDGKVDMSGYKFLPQPGYVNFDFGWWDESTQTFWHANHAETGDPEDPMIVYQSDPQVFAKKKVAGPGDIRYGYNDFDRIIYGLALSHNYDPARAAELASVKK